MSDDLTGRINGWKCNCGYVTYAVHVDHGVTPMFLGCRKPGGCASSQPATSLMYPDADPPPHIIGSVAWEWYRPTEKQTRRLERKHPGMADHVRQGGLDLRPLTDAGRALLGEKAA